jgi:hypothetical protein
MASKNTELRQEQEQKKLKAFLADYEAMTSDLIKKHQMRMIPELKANSHSINAVFAVEVVQYIDVDKSKQSTDEAKQETK